MSSEIPRTFSLTNIDQRAPLNVDHPLNQGRLAWWMSLPSYYGSRAWPNLIVGKPPGILGTFQSGFGWVANSNPGGVGSMYFDGVNSVVNCGVIGTWTPPSMPQMSYKLWINPSAYPTSGFVTPIDSTAFFFVQYAFSTGNLTLGVDVNRTLFNVVNISQTSGTPLNQWTMLTVVFNNPTATGYINGVSKGSILASGTVTASGGSFFIGSNGGTSFPFKGFINDLSIWNRALSPAEVYQDYSLAQRGYPGVFSYIR